MKRKVPMTDKEYIEHQGVLCPFCDSKLIEADPLSTHIDEYELEMTEEVKCLTCSETWKDVYTLIGYTKPGLPDHE